MTTISTAAIDERRGRCGPLARNPARRAPRGRAIHESGGAQRRQQLRVRAVGCDRLAGSEMTSRRAPSKLSRRRRCPCWASQAPEASASASRPTIRSSTPGPSSAPHRLRRADSGIEQRPGPSPERLEEPVDAVARRRHMFHSHPSAERRCGPFHRRNRGRSITRPSARCSCCHAGRLSSSNVNTTTGPRATRRNSASPVSGGVQ